MIPDGSIGEPRFATSKFQFHAVCFIIVKHTKKCLYFSGLTKKGRIYPPPTHPYGLTTKKIPIFWCFIPYEDYFEVLAFYIVPFIFFLFNINLGKSQKKFFS